MSNQNAVVHISEKPWSDYSSSDYSIEQWHAACLIHQHEGAPTSKGQCKLPVKTPAGAVNRNGVHAAAAALAGARGGVNASPEQIASAKRAIRRLYSQLGESPPESMAQSNLIGQEFVEHYGIKGMRWGVRKRRNERERAKSFGRKGRSGGGDGKSVKDLSDAELRQIVNRMQMEQQYANLASSGGRKKKNAGAEFAKSIAKDIAREQIKNSISRSISKQLAARAATGG